MLRTGLFSLTLVALAAPGTVHAQAAPEWIVSHARQLSDAMRPNPKLAAVYDSLTAALAPDCPLIREAIKLQSDKDNISADNWLQVSKLTSEEVAANPSVICHAVVFDHDRIKALVDSLHRCPTNEKVRAVAWEEENHIMFQARYIDYWRCTGKE